MIWPHDRLKKPPQLSLPGGYTLRTYRPGDEKGYIGVMSRAGFIDWNEDSLKGTLGKTLPEGLFFVEHDKARRIVATAVATHKPSELHPFGGELGWVATDPEYRGKGLGLIVCAAVVHRFLEAGYKNIYLQTDNFRLPAIKTYLKLGFVPLFCAPDMERRWQRVREELNYEIRSPKYSCPFRGSLGGTSD